MVAVVGAGGAAGGVLTALERWPRRAVRVWSRTQSARTRWRRASAFWLFQELAKASAVAASWLMLRVAH